MPIPHGVDESVAGERHNVKPALFPFPPRRRLLSRESYPTICPTDGEGCHCDEGVGDELCEPRSPCACGHPKGDHADCGIGPCRAPVSLALWHDSNDRQTMPCRCRSYFEPVETKEVEANG